MEPWWAWDFFQNHQPNLTDPDILNDSMYVSKNVHIKQKNINQLRDSKSKLTNHKRGLVLLYFNINTLLNLNLKVASSVK